MKQEVTVSQTLSKNIEIETDDNIEEDYFYNDHYTPIQLISLFSKTLKKHFPNKTWLIKECEDWIEDELVIT